MSGSSLLPKETIEHLRPASTSSNSIYVLSIGMIALGLSLLPFIKIQVSVKSQGLLRPAIEISTIKIPTSGKISQIFVTLNQQVNKGQKILALDSMMLEQRISYLREEIEEDKMMLKDLKLLILEEDNLGNIATPFYKQSLLGYIQRKRDLNSKLEKSKLSYKRNRQLHEQKVIADAEFEDYTYELENAENELNLLKENQHAQWQTELLQYQQEIAEHETQVTLYEREKSYLIVRAPIAGTIQNLNSIYPESQVFSNQDIAQISPDTTLIVEAYIDPNDIGLLKISMPARFQIDAFNYNQWGLAQGKILEISSDIYILNEKPVFKVRCLLDQDHLQLKNGYKGYFKKGMTLQARFMVTERTLWQLLFDRVDDWLNPNTYVK